jgi:hypothetical protein
VSEENDLPQRDRWAWLRFAIVGPLLAAPPVAGELHDALKALAAKTWRHPFTGLEVRFGVSTIERWLYAAKKAGDPVYALRNQVRADIGRFPSLSAEAVQVLTGLYRAHPGWTAQLLRDNLRVTLAVAGTKCPSYPARLSRSLDRRRTSPTQVVRKVIRQSCAPQVDRKPRTAANRRRLQRDELRLLGGRRRTRRRVQHAHFGS